MKFEKIDVTKANVNPFQRIGQDWMLISAKKEGKVNTMTASWGMMGVFWGKNVVTVGIRPQRFTKEFVDAGDTFTLTFLMVSANRRWVILERYLEEMKIRSTR